MSETISNIREFQMDEDIQTLVQKTGQQSQNADTTGVSVDQCRFFVDFFC